MDGRIKIKIGNKMNFERLRKPYNTNLRTEETEEFIADQLRFEEQQMGKSGYRKHPETKQYIALEEYNQYWKDNYLRNNKMNKEMICINIIDFIKKDLGIELKCIYKTYEYESIIGQPAYIFMYDGKEAFGIDEYHEIMNIGEHNYQLYSDKAAKNLGL